MPTSEETIVVQTAGAQDKENVFQFLKENFYPYEPVSQSIGFPEGPPSVDSVKSLRGIEQGTVLLAKDTRNPDRIVGVALCKIQGESSTESPLDESLPETTRTLWSLFAEVDRAGIKAAGPSWPQGKRVLQLSICCTAAEYRGRGIAKMLAHSVVDLGRALGVGAVTAHCTGPISEHVLCSAGLQRICTIPYDHIPKAKKGASLSFLMLAL